MNVRDQKIIELVKGLAGKFLSSEGGPQSLITVTDATFNERSNLSRIFFTVLPQEKEKAALAFAKRKRSEFRSYVSDNIKMRKIPFFDFEIDLGEKNRQKVDELLGNS